MTALGSSVWCSNWLVEGFHGISGSLDQTSTCTLPFHARNLSQRVGRMTWVCTRESPHAANRFTTGSSRAREGNSTTGAACLDLQTMQRDSPAGVTQAASSVFIVE
jgi:hypothetical protein